MGPLTSPRRHAGYINEWKGWAAAGYMAMPMAQYPSIRPYETCRTTQRPPTGLTRRIARRRAPRGVRQSAIIRMSRTKGEHIQHSATNGMQGRGCRAWHHRNRAAIPARNGEGRPADAAANIWDITVHDIGHGTSPARPTGTCSPSASVGLITTQLGGTSRLRRRVDSS